MVHKSKAEILTRFPTHTSYREVSFLAPSSPDEQNLATNV